MFDFIKNLLHKKGVTLPESMDTPEELLAKAKEIGAENLENVDVVAEKIKQAIPGETDDKIVDQITDKLSSNK